MKYKSLCRVLCVAVTLAVMVYGVSLRSALGQWSNKYWTATPAQEYHQAIVKVRQGNQAGSGTFCHIIGDKGYVLTARHVFSYGVNCSVHWTSGHTARGIVVSNDDNNDTALVQITPLPPNPVIVPIAKRLPPVGTMIEVCGWGGGDNKLRHFYAKFEGASNSYEVSAYTSVISGDSGGAFIHNGQLIGVVSGGPHRTSFGLRDQRGNNWSLVYPASGGGCESILATLFRQSADQVVPRASYQPQPQQYYYYQQPQQYYQQPQGSYCPPGGL